jgi:8-oxo-dGTP pyrophosphatase MutT (NUDIX family)
MTTVKAETQQKRLVDVDSDSITQRFSAYGALLRGDTILVVKTHSNNWELPGGTPEKGETLEQGLERELEEEIGMRAGIGRMFYMRESFYHTPSGKTYHSVQFYFLIHTDENPTAAEAKKYAFVSIKDFTENTTNTSSYLAIQSLENKGSYSLWPK